jgi:glyoxylase-like metal-dependent hydrolase (beta-lactamase superfamily II)
LVAVWAGLGSRDSWGFLLGGAAAHAQAAPRILPAVIEPELPGLGRLEIRAFVVVRGSEAAVVDTLLPGSVAPIQDVLRGAGLGFDAVRHVILTHYHPDHAGSAAEIAAVAPSAAWYAGGPDIPVIQAGIPDFGMRGLSRPVRAVGDGDEVFGLRVVTTPGHTPGHIAVLDPANSALLLGDAALNLGGVLIGSPPAFSTDMVAVGRSLQKIAGLSFQRAIFSHGPEIPSGGPAAIAALLARFPRASDGRSLEVQSPQTQAAFEAAYGDRAGAEWVREHEAELARGGARALISTDGPVCCPFEVRV